MTTEPCPACGALVGDMDLHVGWHGGTLASGACGNSSGIVFRWDEPSPTCALPIGHFGQHTDLERVWWGPDR